MTKLQCSRRMCFYKHSTPTFSNYSSQFNQTQVAASGYDENGAEGGIRSPDFHPIRSCTLAMLLQINVESIHFQIPRNRIEKISRKKQKYRKLREHYKQAGASLHLQLDGGWGTQGYSANQFILVCRSITI